MIKRISLFGLLFWLLSISLAAKYSDHYPFGIYSYLQNTGGFFANNNEYLAQRMQELGYNMTVMDTYNSDKNLDELLKILDANKLDALLTDKCWSNDPGDSRHYALVALSTSFAYRFEAEFSDAKAVKPKDNLSSLYWYGTVIGTNNAKAEPRIGQASSDAGASYGHVWNCLPGRDKAGYAYTDITYRWKDKNGNAVKLSDEIRLYNTQKGKGPDTDSLYFRFRLKLSGFSPSISASTPLFTVSPTGKMGKQNELETAAQLNLALSNEPSVKVEGIFKEKSAAPGKITLQSANAKQGIFSYEDYLRLGKPNGFIELEYAISYEQLKQTKLLTADLDHNPANEDSWWWFNIRGLSPLLYWHGNCELSLDYIEIEDQIYRNLRTQPDVYAEKIKQRVDKFLKLPHGDVIKHFYTMDEPFQANLSSLKLLREMLPKTGYSTMTTIYDTKYRELAMDDGQTYYDHVAFAREFLEPDYMMTDIYPVKPGLRYAPKEPNFIQEVLQNRMLKTYRECKEYSLKRPERKFFPVVQAAGWWSGKQWLSWCMPPQATQLALIYLPLCYQPDGIMHYRLHGFVQKDGSGEYAPIIAAPDGLAKEYQYLYEPVKNANPRAKYYAKHLLELKWLGADTAHKNKQTPAKTVAAMGITQTQVVKSGGGDYSGYIECGYYLNEANQLTVMAVNRRTDYFNKPGKDGPANPDQVHPDNYAKYFSAYKPQTLRLHLQKNLLGPAPALYDPYDNSLWVGKKDRVELSLAAGEGRMLSLVSSLPAKVKKGSYRFTHPLILGGKTLIAKQGKIVCEGDLILLPGSSLTLSKGSEVIVHGRVIRMEGSVVNAGGKFVEPGE